MPDRYGRASQDHFDFTWALLLFWFALRYCGRRVIAGTGVFLLLTLLCTLGRGEHYVIDLIVAVPFAAGLWVLAERRWVRAGLAMLIVSLWCVALNQGWALTLPRTVVWFACALTVAPFSIPDLRFTRGRRTETFLHSPASKPCCTRNKFRRAGTNT